VRLNLCDWICAIGTGTFELWNQNRAIRTGNFERRCEISRGRNHFAANVHRETLYRHLSAIESNGPDRLFLWRIGLSRREWAADTPAPMNDSLARIWG